METTVTSFIRIMNSILEQLKIIIIWNLIIVWIIVPYALAVAVIYNNSRIFKQWLD